MRDKNFLDKLPSVLDYRYNIITPLLEGATLYIVDTQKVLSYGSVRLKLVDTDRESFIKFSQVCTSELINVVSGIAYEAYLVPKSEAFKYVVSIGNYGADITLPTTHLELGGTVVIDSMRIDAPRSYLYMPKEPEKVFDWSEDGVREKNGVLPIQRDAKDWWDE